MSITELLRSHGSKLPVELWHSGLVRIGQDEQDYLNSIPLVTIKAASNYVLPGVTTSELKASLISMALLYSEIQEILYLSGDTIPLQNPEHLFNSTIYKNEHTLMWPGFYGTSPGNPIFELLDIDCKVEKVADRGQILLNKSNAKVMEALEMSLFLQRQWKLFSRLLPDSFDLIRYAYRMVGAEYHMVKWYPGLLGTYTNNRFCGNSMLSFSPNRNRAQKLKKVDVLFFRIRKLGEEDKLPSREVRKLTRCWILPSFIQKGKH